MKAGCGGTSPAAVAAARCATAPCCRFGGGTLTIAPTRAAGSARTRRRCCTCPGRPAQLSGRGPRPGCARRPAQPASPAVERHAAALGRRAGRITPARPALALGVVHSARRPDVLLAAGHGAAQRCSTTSSAHEVAHLAEMNHSPRFWAVVRRLCPEIRAGARLAAAAWRRRCTATTSAPTAGLDGGRRRRPDIAR